MTRAQLMNTALPTIEGLYAAYGELFPVHARGPCSFCVIGPTRDELAALAPTVLQFLDERFSEEHPPGLHLPVHAGGSLRDVAEAFSDWFGGYSIPWGLCILLPEGVVADWPEGQRVFAPEMLQCLHPTLLLADLLQNASPGFIAAIPDSALLDNRGRIQRSMMAQAIFLGGGRDDLLSGNLPERLTGYDKYLQSPESSHPRPSYPNLHKVWTNREYGSGLCPRFVWAHEVEGCEEAVSVVHLSSREDDHICSGMSEDPQIPKAPLATHLRRLGSAMVRDLQSDQAAIERLARVALGQMERADDDRFVPRWELGPSGIWAAGGEIDRDLAGFRGITATQGHELRRVESLAHIKPIDDWSPGERHPSTLWFVAEGTDVLRCLRTAPVAPERQQFFLGEEYQRRMDEEYPRQLDAWHAHRKDIRLLAISDCEDADYLWLAMSDDVLFENLRCRSAKSYWAPSVSAAVLGETLVPWPSETERKRLVKLFRDSAQLVEKGDAGELIQELKYSWESMEHNFAPHNFCKVGARDLGDAWTYMIEEARELLKSLEQLEVSGKPPAPRPGKPEAPPAQVYPPAPIAILRRELSNEQAPSRRIRAALELAQVTLELDAAILLSLLHRVNPSYVSDVWTKVSSKPGNALLSLGHKKQLAQEARRALASAVGQGKIDRLLSQLATGACEIDLKTWNKLADEIVQFRNENIGHGFQSPPAVERSVSEALVPKVEKFVDLLIYLNTRMLVFLESRTISRTGTICALRMLVHDNPLFPRNELMRAKGTAIDGLDEKEVYLHYAEPDEFLSLWPWVLFRAGRTGREVPWFFDGTKSGAGVYKSVLAPGESFTDDAAGRAALSLMGRP
ncbi:MAG TPA: hypothetical protein VIM11_23685 [Tepidisphaeraceae bacterium]|jgi:hypothetical protein